MLFVRHSADTESMQTSGAGSSQNKFGIAPVYGQQKFPKIDMASSGYQSTTYGNFSEVNLNDPAEVYIDQILNKGMCSHQKRQKGYGDTLRNRRDKHLLTKQPEEREMEAYIKTRFSQVNKQTKQMQQELHSIQNHLYKIKKSQPGKPANM